MLTELGNALGFIRLLRTASLNYLTTNTEFIPFIEDYRKSFNDTAVVLGYGSVTQANCQELDEF